MSLFERAKPPELVMNGRFELERDGEVAYLEYSLSGKVLELIHTEVPEKMRRTGVATSLIESALQWAREHQVKIDVTCPIVAGYIKKHSEHSDLLVR